MKRWQKRVGIGLLAMVGVVLLAGAGLYGLTEGRLDRSFEVQVESVAVGSDEVAIERGRHMANPIAKCTDCHGANMQGQVMINNAMFARIVSANITRGKGGVGGNYATDADWVRAIRHGVRPDGTPLIFMPSQEYYHLNDQDLGDMIAWLKTLPPQDNELPATRIGPIGRALFAAKALPLLAAELIDHSGPRPVAVEPSVSVEYGAYLARVGGCLGCHGENLAGSKSAAGPPGSPPPTNLTPAGPLAQWTEQDFFNALRTGRRPDGSEIDSFMPWRFTAQMTDDEIRAVWLYVKTVAPAETTET